MSERIYRDSVHDIIRIETDSDEGRLLVALVDTPEFQRLRRVRQLGLAHFAYQAAEHSRFTHSLGAFHLATRMLERLGRNYKISNEEQTAVRVAALLHDVGHGAFSHVIESILGFHHEQFTIDAVLSEETSIGKLLRGFSSTLSEDVASIIRGNFRPMALAQLISSQLDVDRMDYLLRDSLMTGATLRCRWPGQELGVCLKSQRQVPHPCLGVPALEAHPGLIAPRSPGCDYEWVRQPAKAGTPNRLSRMESRL